jgi:hypothetical protein
MVFWYICNVNTCYFLPLPSCCALRRVGLCHTPGCRNCRVGKAMHEGHEVIIINALHMGMGVSSFCLALQESQPLQENISPFLLQTGQHCGR